MYWRDITDQDTVTSVLPARGERYYLVNGKSPWWKQGEDFRSYGEMHEALRFLCERDTTRTAAEKSKALAYYAACIAAQGTS